MLVGRFNTITKNLKRIIGKEYQVQLGTDIPEIVSGMLKIDMPDLILISTMGMERGHKEIFADIKINYPQIPVVYVGTAEELEMFKEFEKTEQFDKIERPVQVKIILQAINRILTGIAEEEEIDEKKPQGKKRILVIDDSRIQRNALKNMLKDYYNVMDCASGKEAFQRTKKWLPDLILLDYDMPDQDGKEVFELFQKDKRYCEVPVVFITGVKEREKIQSVLGLLPAGYLLKPVEQNRLMELLEELIG